MRTARITQGEIYEALRARPHLPREVAGRLFLYERLQAEGFCFKPLNGPLHLYYFDPELEAPWKLWFNPDNTCTYVQGGSPPASSAEAHPTVD